MALTFIFTLLFVWHKTQTLSSRSSAPRHKYFMACLLLCLLYRLPVPQDAFYVLTICVWICVCVGHVFYLCALTMLNQHSIVIWLAFMPLLILYGSESFTALSVLVCVCVSVCVFGIVSALLWLVFTLTARRQRSQLAPYTPHTNFKCPCTNKNPYRNRKASSGVHTRVKAKTFATAAQIEKLIKPKTQNCTVWHGILVKGGATSNQALQTAAPLKPATATSQATPNY